MPIKKRPKKPVQSDRIRGAEAIAMVKAEAGGGTNTIDCSRVDLTKLINDAVDNGADEIVLRISRFDPELRPAKFQSIVKFSNRGRPWAVHVTEDAATGLFMSLTDAAPSKPIRKTNDKPTSTLQRNIKPRRKGIKGAARKRTD